jgi:hypothetical protein
MNNSYNNAINNKYKRDYYTEKLKELRNELQSWSDVARDLPVYKELEAKLMAAKPTSVAPQKGMQLSDLSGKEASDFRTVGKKTASPKAAPRKSFLSFITGR